jgi:hypothetical protein
MGNKTKITAEDWINALQYLSKLRTCQRW